MKFIHMSDLHLGSPFAGLSAEEAARRYDSQFSVLDAVLRKAASMKIGLVLISGDVFDDIVVSQKTVSGFFRRLAGYPGISFVISPGNHDYYTPEGYYSGAGIPENVFIFRSDELTKFEFPELGADVYGFAFTSDSKFGPPALIPDGDSGRVRILCCHGALDDPQSPYCPIYVSSLGLFDYAALGHIHTYSVKKYGNATIAYSGCPEGRDFGEAGRKGVLLVDTGGDGPTVSFLRMPGVTYFSERLDVTGITGQDELEKAFLRLVSETDDADRRKSAVIRVTLTGRLSKDVCVDEQALISSASEYGFSEVSVKDETSPDYSGAELEKDISLRGCYYRALKSGLESPDPAVRRRYEEALRMGLNAIDGLPILK